MTRENNKYIAYNGTAFDSAEACIDYEQVHIITDYADGIKFFDEQCEYCDNLSDVIVDAAICRIINAKRALEMMTVVESWNDSYILSFFMTSAVYKDNDILFYHYVRQCWIPREKYAWLHNILNGAFSLGN